MSEQRQRWAQRHADRVQELRTELQGLNEEQRRDAAKEMAWHQEQTVILRENIMLPAKDDG